MAFKNYGQGYTGFSNHVTGGHEAEAYEAEMAKKPNRFGMLILRLLGFKGTPPPPSTEHHRS